MCWILCESLHSGKMSPSVQSSRSVMPNSWWPHEAQHTRPPCLSPTPGVYSHSCKLSQWCHPTISSSIIPFSSCLQSFPESGSFQMSQVAKVLEFQLQHISFQWLISFRTDWLDLLAVQRTLKSLLWHHSSKASILRCSAFFIVQLSHPYMTTGKTTALTRWTFVGKVTSLLFKMLSTLVIAFLPRSKHLLISCLQSPSAVILDSPKIKSVTVSTVSPFICHEVMEPNAMILVFWVLSFKPIFSLSSFTFIKRLFSSLLSAIRVVSSAYLRSLIFLLAVLIPACASSSPVFLMMYPAYKLNKSLNESLSSGKISWIVSFMIPSLNYSCSLTAYYWHVRIVDFSFNFLILCLPPSISLKFPLTSPEIVFNFNFSSSYWNFHFCYHGFHFHRPCFVLWKLFYWKTARKVNLLSLWAYW